MSLKGFVEYQRREFCNDVKCPIQMELNIQKDKAEYEKIRQVCSVRCKYTTWQFHHWLIEKGFIILASSKLKNSERTVLANIDKNLIDWIDLQVQTRKYHDRNQIIESALSQYKKNQEQISAHHPQNAKT
jgi:hypothetical protein